jgi:hypothetical protein
MTPNREPPLVRSAVLSALVGLVASGLGLAAWSIAGAVLTGAWRDVGAIIGTGLGGLLAGIVLGRFRDLALVCFVAAVPLLLIAWLVIPQGRLVPEGFIRVAAELLAATQAVIVLVAGLIGVGIGRWSGIGPVRSAAGLAMLTVAAVGAAMGWLWFAATMPPVMR